MKKIILSVSAIALAFAFSVSFVGAATNSDSVLKQFNTNLTKGSKGSDVSDLQTYLVASGDLVIPAGVSMGNFGSLTKSALAKFQARMGIAPAAGYFGPKTQAYVNTHAATGGSVGSTVGLCPNGMTLASNCMAGSTGSTVGNTTPGVEGTINLTQESSGVMSSVYEGDTKASLIGFKVEAKSSDVNVQRVNVTIGTSTNAYTKVFSKIYLIDANGNVLASKSLNSSTVNRESSNRESSTKYTVTLSGFNALVKKDAKSSFYIAFDLAGGISTEYRGTQTLTIETSAVRAQDGAGIDQYSGSGFSRSVTISKSLSDSASLTLSTDPNVVKSNTYPANSGSASNEADKVTVASFRALAEKDGVLVRDLTISASSTANLATQPTAYLYNGSTQIASASGVTTGTITVYAFTSIDQTIAKDMTNTYTVKVDVRGAVSTADIFKINKVSVSSAESLVSGTTVTVTDLTTVGNDITFVSQGVVTDLSSKNINITTVRDTNGVTTEAHLTSGFNVAINAIGSDAVFNGTSTAFSFKLYRGSTDVTTLATYSTVEYNQNNLPSAFTASTTGTGFTVPRNTSGTMAVNFRVDVTGSTTVASLFPNTGTYSVRLNGITYTVGGSSITNDNSANQAFVTDSVSRP